MSYPVGSRTHHWTTEPKFVPEEAVEIHMDEAQFSGCAWWTAWATLCPAALAILRKISPAWW